MHQLLERRPAGWQIIAVLAALGLAAYYTILADSTDGQDVLYNVYPVLGAAGAVIAATRRGGAHRRSWWLFAIGLGSMALGELSWTVLAGLGDVPNPSIADLFYLGGYAGLTLATWWICTSRPLRDREALLDSLILATAAGLVLWFVIIERRVTAETSPDAVAIAIGYPMIDIAIIGIIARVLLGRQHLTFMVRALTVGIAAYCASDIVYAMQSLDGTYDNGLVDAGWMIGYALMGIAAAHPSAAARLSADGPVALFSRSRLTILAGASLLAPVLALVQLATGSGSGFVFATACSILLFVLVILRMDGAFSDLKRTLHQRHVLEEQLVHQASHDPLTALANRALLVERLADDLAECPERTAVILLDLDDFKSVNDTLGHGAGDALLVEIARRLTTACRPEDLIARLGGDEFAVVLRDSDPESSMAVARRILGALRPACEIDHHQVFVDASAGVAVGQPDTQPGDLLRDADIAMYLAKSQGKGRIERFEPIMGVEVVQRVQLRAELADAIEGHELVLHYQPIVSLVDGGLQRFEALVRWAHPTRGLLAPIEFIPLAEATGLVVPLGRWVLREACLRASAWNRLPGGGELGIAVNVAAAQLRHPAFIGDVAAALREADLAPELLTLELTESVVLELEAASRTLTELKGLGVHLAIDDFGTGYSSLSYLAALPIDLIKIDRSFTAALMNEDSGAAIASIIVAIGRTLNVETVAEGIEIEEQLQALRALGCRLGQGFLISHPVPDEAVVAMLGARQPPAVDAAA